MVIGMDSPMRACLGRPGVQQQDDIGTRRIGMVGGGQRATAAIGKVVISGEKARADPQENRWSSTREIQTGSSESCVVDQPQLGSMVVRPPKKEVFHA